jgi:hypothetical protein
MQSSQRTPLKSIGNTQPENQHLSKSVDFRSPRWFANSTDCFVCKEKFGVLNRRHHCHICTKSVCGGCSLSFKNMTSEIESSFIMNIFAEKKGTRLCRGCRRDGSKTLKRQTKGKKSKGRRNDKIKTGIGIFSASLGEQDLARTFSASLGEDDLRRRWTLESVDGGRSEINSEALERTRVAERIVLDVVMPTAVFNVAQLTRHCGRDAACVAASAAAEELNRTDSIQLAAVNTTEEHSPLVNTLNSKLQEASVEEAGMKALSSQLDEANAKLSLHALEGENAKLALRALEEANVKLEEANMKEEKAMEIVAVAEERAVEAVAEAEKKTMEAVVEAQLLQEKLTQLQKKVQGGAVLPTPVTRRRVTFCETGSNSTGVQLYEAEASSKHVLGQCGSTEEGSAKDAVSHFEKEAKSGSASGWYNLGVAHFEGRGVQQNTAKAMQLWKEAAAGGNAKAAYSLACLFVRSERDAGQSKRHLCMAASWGHEGAKMALRGLNEDKAQEMPPNELLGHRLVVFSRKLRGAGIVTNFRKGKVMGMGPSSHTLRFDDGSTKALVLRRHGNGGVDFALEEDVLEETKCPLPNGVSRHIRRA